MPGGRACFRRRIRGGPTPGILLPFLIPGQQLGMLTQHALVEPAHVADDTGWIAACQHVRWNIALHDGTRRDCRAIANRYPRHDQTARPDSHETADPHRRGSEADPLILRDIKIMAPIDAHREMGTVGKNPHPGPDMATFTDFEPAGPVQNGVMPDETAILEDDLFRTLDYRGITHAHPSPPLARGISVTAQHARRLAVAPPSIDAGARRLPPSRRQLTQQPRFHRAISERTAWMTSSTSASVNAGDSGRLTVCRPIRMASGVSSGRQPSRS